MSNFDGVGFSELVIVFILVVLFFFGSDEIKDLTSGPTPL